MVRLAWCALTIVSLPAAAWSNPPASPENTQRDRSFHLPRISDHGRFMQNESIGRTNIGPNADFGIGMFGLKAEKTHLRPATGREIIAPKQRRAAVGFSLKF